MDDELLVHEEFIGLYEVLSIDTTLVAVIKDTLLRLKLTLVKAQGQCYDGASSMSGVAKQIWDEQTRAFSPTAMITARVWRYLTPSRSARH